MADHRSRTQALVGAGMLLLGSPALSADSLDESIPSLEFLEYLGEWQDGNGQMVDPLVLDDAGSLESELEKGGAEQ